MGLDNIAPLDRSQPSLPTRHLGPRPGCRPRRTSTDRGTGLGGLWWAPHIASFGHTKIADRQCPAHRWLIDWSDIHYCSTQNELNPVARRCESPTSVRSQETPLLRTLSILPGPAFYL